MVASRKRSSHKPHGKCKQAVGTRAQVWHGTAHHTAGGLTKADLMMNKFGRIVSKLKHKQGLKSYRKLSKCNKAKFNANKGRGFSKKRTRKSYKK